MDENTLVNNFIENAILEGKYTQSGDHKKVNETYWEIIKGIKEIYRIDPEFDSLVGLLNHQDESVKKWAASVLLFSDKKENARKVLKEISEDGGLAAFTAEMTLSEWDKGNLKPFYDL
jgi:hypothetical protein